VLSPREYAAFITDAFVDERLVGAGSVPVVVVDEPVDGLPEPGSLPVVVLAVGDTFGGAGPSWADAVVGAGDVDEIVAAIRATPLAATTLVTLLRALPSVSVEHGLALESAAYSTLQAGPEFRAWRDGTPAQPADDTEPTVIATRRGPELTVSLHRPHRHNAISSRLRDDLSEALRIAEVDHSITSVVLRGDGPSFCSGGDLAEFGSRADPATAHSIRLARSPARQLHRLSSRTTAYVHGATLGGGLELAAFAGRVVARPDTSLGLPELGLGLIPGAGGTVSLTRRIGRQRTALLALSCRRIDVDTARRWGIVDDITS
jgi:hypothetical protein